MLALTVFGKGGCEQLCLLFLCCWLKKLVLNAALTRTFECISVTLCLEPILASPALVFAAATAFVPPAAPLMIAVLKEEFLPIASKGDMLQRKFFRHFLLFCPFV